MPDTATDRDSWTEFRVSTTDRSGAPRVIGIFTSYSTALRLSAIYADSRIESRVCSVLRTDWIETTP